MLTHWEPVEIHSTIACTLKTVSCHDANFVVAFGIVKTQGFHFWGYILELKLEPMCDILIMHVGLVMKLRLSCYLVLLSIRLQESRSFVTWPISYYSSFLFYQHVLADDQGAFSAHWSLGDVVAPKLIAPWDICVKFLMFKLNLVIDRLCISCEITLRWMSLGLTDGKSGNGLVQSSNKPLPEPLLTKLCVATWCHKGTVS